MGKSQPFSSNDEWIELYNNTNSDIDLNGWKIVSDDGTPSIILNGIIPGQNFYLLERTNDETVPEIAANQIYVGALGNDGENLKLIDKDNLLIDEIKINNGWPAGDNSTKQTMERTSSETWATSQEVYGTPGKKNNTSIIESPVASFLPEPISTTLPEPTNYPRGIIFNEILPSPLGPDENEEWIEIYNQNNFIVNLSGWQISDSLGQVKAYSFPNNTTINAKSYLVINRPESKITLNNQEDELLIFNPDQEIVDSIHYKTAVSGQSFSRFSNGWSWTNQLTPASANAGMKEERKSSPLGNQEEIPISASILQGNLEKVEDNNSWFLRTVLTAIALAALSGITVLMLKRLVGGINNS
ncbi:lamin tail domain-containing protein [Candidatus Parcubacteria bacterium]|nr:lamin tail domain-containing protein [Patescibacteria group bacterium]MBU4466874.1 lamin tail domain-containing protein [Patescibacteria group bacterium]MCG2688112.1 lamin tail domain-containing protein [Candidatus Parcubacteria bacterium]